ncbi:MAG: cytochrome c5 family protein [Nitrospirota bacterium]|nr:MAG: cytochrome c5 family protein [Nitrospirota bacterium]
MKSIILIILLILFITVPAMAERTGKQIYESKCASCHGTGVGGAPRFGKAADWESHKKSGLGHMLSHVKKGVGIMPPKGGCNDCTDAELKDAINYILSNSK